MEAQDLVRLETQLAPYLSRVEDCRCMLDDEVVLPKRCSDDWERCRAAGIPEEMVYRPKGPLAWERHDRRDGEGVKVPWLTADEEYEGTPGF